MESIEDKKIKISEIIKEEEERIIEFCKRIPGYDEITELNLECILCKHDMEEDDLRIDTLYISDNLGYLDMLIIYPAILYPDLLENHLESYHFHDGYKIPNRDGYLIILTNQNEEGEE